jgi:hypothetical protein
VAKLVSSSERPYGLLLCNYAVDQGAVVAESVNSFHDYSRFPYHIYSWSYGFNEDFDFDMFDFIVIHYSIIPSLPGFLNAGVIERIRRFKGVKVQMIQDDYRMNSVLIQFIKYCGIDVVYTVAPPEAARALYTDKVSGLDVVTYLTGYVSHWLTLTEPLPLRKRRYDVGYRGRKYPYWFGQPVIDKVELAGVLAKELSRNGLRHSISTREKDRVYGRAWINFLRNCRAIFGMESDIHYVDPLGYIHHWYDTVEKLVGKERWNAKEALLSPFFHEHAYPAPAPLAVIPPRVFEAIGVRSANVLIEGEYSGVLKPWRHYIPLKRDLSNVGDVMRALRDDALLVDIISVAFAEIGQKRTYTYQGFADLIDGTIERHLGRRAVASAQLRERADQAGSGEGQARGHRPEVMDHADSVLTEEATGRATATRIEAVNKIAPLYYLGNPNAISVENPRAGKPMRFLRRAVAAVARYVGKR